MPYVGALAPRLTTVMLPLLHIQICTYDERCRHPVTIGSCQAMPYFSMQVIKTKRRDERTVFRLGILWNDAMRCDEMWFLLDVIILSLLPCRNPLRSCDDNAIQLTTITTTVKGKKKEQERMEKITRMPGSPLHQKPRVR